MHLPPIRPPDTIISDGDPVRRPVLFGPVSDDRAGRIEAPDGMSFLELLRLLRKHRRLVLAFVLLGLAAGVLVSWVQTPLYRSQATIEILDWPGADLDTLGVVSTASERRVLETARAKLLSRELSAQVVDRLDLAADPIFWRQHGAWHFRWANAANAAGDMPHPTFEQRQRWALDSVQRGLSAQTVRDTALVTVDYVHPDPGQAARVLDLLTREFVRMTIDERVGAASTARDFLARQAQSARQELEKAENALVLHAQAAGTTMHAGEHDVVAEAIADVSRRLAQARQRSDETADLVARIKQGGSMDLSQVLQSPVVQTAKARLAELRAQYRQRGTTQQPGFPAMQALSASIGEIEGQIAAEVRSISQAITIEHQQSAQLVQALERELVALTRKHAELERNKAGQKVLERDVVASRSQYEALIDKHHGLVLAANLQAPAATIVDPPLAPLDPTTPRTELNIALAGMLSALAAIAAIYVREQCDERFASIRQIENTLGVPVLATIPELTTHPDAMMMDSPPIAVAEAIRLARTALHYAAAPLNHAVMVVTSAEKGEGKTCTAGLLAREFAAIGRRVLVIDANFRQPAMHALFDVPLEQGLGSLLMNTQSGKGTFICQTSIAGLDVMTAGAEAPDPSNLLASHRMGAVIDQCRRHYDLIVIDTPQINGLSDALTIARWADSIVLVAAVQRLTRPVATQAIDQLHTVGGRLTGLIATQVCNTSSTYWAPLEGTAATTIGSTMRPTRAADDQIIGWEGYALAEQAPARPPRNWGQG